MNVQKQVFNRQNSKNTLTLPTTVYRCTHNHHNDQCRCLFSLDNSPKKSLRNFLWILILLHGAKFWSYISSAQSVSSMIGTVVIFTDWRPFLMHSYKWNHGRHLTHASVQKQCTWLKWETVQHLKSTDNNQVRWEWLQCKVKLLQWWQHRVIIIIVYNKPTKKIIQKYSMTI